MILLVLQSFQNMRTVNETPRAESKIKGLGLWDEYEEAKERFITNPSSKSLDFCIWDRKLRIWSFKITSQYRVKLISRSNNSWEVFSAGDFHRKQAKR